MKPLNVVSEENAVFNIERDCAYRNYSTSKTNIKLHLVAFFVNKKMYLRIT
jgi:hypothetical protein